MTFRDLQIIEPILQALKEKEYEIPTPIQEKAIPVILNKRDILGCAQTGTGKTAAFAIPILQLLNQEHDDSNKRKIKSLILTPTRELAIQIDENFTDYGKHLPLRHCVIFGGVKQKAQTDKLSRGIDILIATPGRLLDLISQKFISLKDVEYFVLDEADRMLDMGFIHDIKKLLPLLPKEKQTLFFSATMPDAIATLSKKILRNPTRVEVAPASSTIDTVKQYLYYVNKEDKKSLLITLLKQDSEQSVLVFSRTKHGANNIAKTLCNAGIESEAIHGNKSQNARQKALSNFKDHSIRVLIATDIAARGIDIEQLPIVINYDLPDVPETYVHRIGRTGRAGNKGISISFCMQEEKQQLKDILKLTGNQIKVLKTSNK